MARDPTLRSETFRYDRGASQQFKQPAFTVNPAAFDEDEVSTLHSTSTKLTQV